MIQDTFGASICISVSLFTTQRVWTVLKVLEKQKHVILTVLPALSSWEKGPL